MHLPERTANSGVYLLSGQLPIEADIEKKYLTQLMNILRSEGWKRNWPGDSFQSKTQSQRAGSYMYPTSCQNTTFRQYMIF